MPSRRTSHAARAPRRPASRRSRCRPSRARSPRAGCRRPPRTARPSGPSRGPAAGTAARSRARRAAPPRALPAAERAEHVAALGRGAIGEPRRREREAGEARARRARALVRAAPADAARQQQHAAAEQQQRGAERRHARRVRRAFLARSHEPDAVGVDRDVLRRRGEAHDGDRERERAPGSRAGRARRARAARARSPTSAPAIQCRRSP